MLRPRCHCPDKIFELPLQWTLGRLLCLSSCDYRHIYKSMSPEGEWVQVGYCHGCGRWSREQNLEETSAHFTWLGEPMPWPWKPGQKIRLGLWAPSQNAAK